MGRALEQLLFTQLVEKFAVFNYTEKKQYHIHKSLATGQVHYSQIHTSHNSCFNMFNQNINFDFSSFFEMYQVFTRLLFAMLPCILGYPSGVLNGELGCRSVLF
jgi:hypothetical protein